MKTYQLRPSSDFFLFTGIMIVYIVFFYIYANYLYIYFEASSRILVFLFLIPIYPILVFHNKFLKCIVKVDRDKIIFTYYPIKIKRQILISNILLVKMNHLKNGKTRLEIISNRSRIFFMCNTRNNSEKEFYNFFRNLIVKLNPKVYTFSTEITDYVNKKYVGTSIANKNIQHNRTKRIGDLSIIGLILFSIFILPYIYIPN